MKPLTIRDLFALTLIVAVHIAICKLAVTFRDSSLTTLVMLSPTALALWVHSRVGGSWTTGSFIHYLTTIAWSFFYGLTYSFFYIRRQPSEFYEKDSVGLEHLFSFAMFSLEVFMLLGLMTSVMYWAFGYSIATWAQRFGVVQSTVTPNNAADEPYVGPETSKDSLGDG